MALQNIFGLKSLNVYIQLGMTKLLSPSNDFPNLKPTRLKVFSKESSFYPKSWGNIFFLLFIFPLFVCFLSALSDSHSNFLLNGNFVVAMFKREIPFKGTVIEYSGSDTKEERINCTERIEEELILQARLMSLSLSRSSVCFCLYLSLLSLSLAFSVPLSSLPSSLLLYCYKYFPYHCCPRSCVWGTCTTQMCATPSTSPSRSTGNSLCGTPQAPGWIVASCVRVRS